MRRAGPAILEAALELFRAQGIEATTIEQICERADVANRTFFNHFPTRRDMVRALANERVRNLHVVLAERADEPARDRLVRFFDDIAAHLESLRSGLPRGDRRPCSPRPAPAPTAARRCTPRSSSW